MVHTKRRNRLSIAQMTRLVFCNTNARLSDRLASIVDPLEVLPSECLLGDDDPADSTTPMPRADAAADIAAETERELLRVRRLLMDRVGHDQDTGAGQGTGMGMGADEEDEDDDDDDLGIPAPGLETMAEAELDAELEAEFEAEYRLDHDRLQRMMAGLFDPPLPEQDVYRPDPLPEDIQHERETVDAAHVGDADHMAQDAFAGDTAEGGDACATVGGIDGVQDSQAPTDVHVDDDSQAPTDRTRRVRQRTMSDLLRYGNDEDAIDDIGWLSPHARTQPHPAPSAAGSHTAATRTAPTHAAPGHTAPTHTSSYTVAPHIPPSAPARRLPGPPRHVTPAFSFGVQPRPHLAAAAPRPTPAMPEGSTHGPLLPAGYYPRGAVLHQPAVQPYSYTPPTFRVPASRATPIPASAAPPTASTSTAPARRRPGRPPGSGRGSSQGGRGPSQTVARRQRGRPRGSGRGASRITLSGTQTEGEVLHDFSQGATEEDELDDFDDSDATQPF